MVPGINEVPRSTRKEGFYESFYQADSTRTEHGRRRKSSDRLGHYFDSKQQVYSPMGKESSHTSSTDTNTGRQSKSSRTSSCNSADKQNVRGSQKRSEPIDYDTQRGRGSNHNRQPKSRKSSRGGSMRTGDKYHGEKKKRVDETNFHSERRKTMDHIPSNHDVPQRGFSSRAQSNGHIRESHHSSRNEGRRRHSIDQIPSQSHFKHIEKIQSERGRQARKWQDGENVRSQSEYRVRRASDSSNGAASEFELLCSRGVHQEIQRKRSNDDKKSDALHHSSHHSTNNSNKRNTRSKTKRRHSVDDVPTRRRSNSEVSSDQYPSTVGRRRHSLEYTPNKSGFNEQIQSERGQGMRTLQNSTRMQSQSERGIKASYSFGAIQNDRSSADLQAKSTKSRKDKMGSGGGFLMDDTHHTDINARYSTFKRQKGKEYGSNKNKALHDVDGGSHSMQPALSQSEHANNNSRQNCFRNSLKKSQSWSNSGMKAPKKHSSEIQKPFVCNDAGRYGSNHLQSQSDHDALTKNRKNEESDLYHKCGTLPWSNVELHSESRREMRLFKSGNRAFKKSHSWSSFGPNLQTEFGREVENFFDPRDDVQRQSVAKAQSLRLEKCNKNTEVLSNDKKIRPSNQCEKLAEKENESNQKKYFEQRSSKARMKTYKKSNESKYLPPVRDWRTKARAFRQARSSKRKETSGFSSGMIAEPYQIDKRVIPMSEAALYSEAYEYPLSDPDPCCSRRTMCKILKYLPVFVIIAVAAGVLTIVLGKGNDSANNDGKENDKPPSISFDEYVDPFEGKNNLDASRWHFQFGEGLKLGVLNALDTSWDVTFYLALHEWNSGSDSIDLTVTRMKRDLTCNEVMGYLKVCNNDYGETKWRGLNEVLLKDGYIISSVAKMNEHYLHLASDDRRQYTMCHELGHGLGLQHTDENFTNPDLGNCMDYTDFPGNNKQPNWMNFEALSNLYGPAPNKRRMMLRSSIGDQSRSLEPVSSFPEELRGLIEEVRRELDKDILLSSDKFNVTKSHKSNGTASVIVNLNNDYTLLIRALLAK